MGIRKHFLGAFMLLSLCISISAQNFSTLYKEGKAYFDQEQFALAMTKFASITSSLDNSEVVRFASYYYAVSAFESGDANLSKSMFLQIQQKFPQWDVQPEVNFWLAFLAANENDAEATFNYLREIPRNAKAEEVESLKFNVIQSIDDVNRLEYLLRGNPDEVSIASRLVEVILSQDVADQDIDRLKELQENFDLKLNLLIEGIDSSPKKAVYNVGLFLPFNYRDDSVSLVRLESNWAVRMQRGVEIAVEQLQEAGTSVNLITIDTRDRQARLKDILATGQCDDLDLIIGPVMQGAVRTATNFAKEKKINLINPLSSNSEILKDNPYAFLYNPSNETIAVKAAEYAAEHFSHNKNVAVFYSGIGDKPRADLYKELIEKDSFKVAIFEGIRPQESVKIQQLFTDEEEVEKDSLIVADMLAEMNSLREAEVEDWEIYNERDFYEDSLMIRPDSIGHIFVASDISSHVASAMSGIESREDTIYFITSSKFLNAESSVSFDQLDRLDAVMIGANYMDYTTEEVQEFRIKYVDTFLSSPVREERLGDAYLGYDIMMTYGKLLGEYGKYFQIGLKRRRFIEGQLTEKFNYQFSNDNKYVPVLKFKDTQVIKVEDLTNGEQQ